MKRHLLALGLALPLLGACTSDDDADADIEPTFRFEPRSIVATRDPANAPCGEHPSPPRNDDLFSLRAETNAPGAKVTFLRVSYRRDVATGVPHDVLHDTSVSLEVVPARALVETKIVVDRVPSQDGEVTSAYVAAAFADGEALVTVLGAPVSSGFGNCPTSEPTSP